MNRTKLSAPLFHPGRLLITPETQRTLLQGGVSPISVVLRHIAGDWGVVSDDDKRQNDLSVAVGLRLLSVYRLPDGSRLIVVTEWDRSCTTIDLIAPLPASSGTYCSQGKGYPALPVTRFTSEGRV